MADKEMTAQEEKPATGQISQPGDDKDISTLALIGIIIATFGLFYFLAKILPTLI